MKRVGGSIHQSVVYVVLNGDRVLISPEPTRVKGRAVAREGWASLCVHGNDKPYPALSLEGPAELLEEGLAEPTRKIMTKILGTAPDMEFTNGGVRNMNRRILQITPSRVYAVNYL